MVITYNFVEFTPLTINRIEGRESLVVWLVLVKLICVFPVDETK